MLREFASVVMTVAALALTAGSGVAGDQSGATTKAAFRPLEDSVIAITDPVPADDGMRGSLNPPLSATIRHAGGKPMTITFSTDASGQWRDFAVFKQASSGTYRATPKDMLRRGRTYCWKVAATDGQVTTTKPFTFNLAYVVGPSHSVIMTSDCWKYGYIKHGWEKGQFFATVQRGMWAAYDLDKGWYRTHQLIAKNKYPAGVTGSVPVQLMRAAASGTRIGDTGTDRITRCTACRRCGRCRVEPLTGSASSCFQTISSLSKSLP